MQGGLEWGGLVPRPGIEPGPLHWEHRVLATGPPGKSPKYCVYGSLKKKIKENDYNSATCKIWPKHTVGPQTCQDFTERWQVKLYVGQRGESQARSHALSSPASPRRVPGGSECPSPDTWARTSWNCSLVRGSRKVVRTLRSALLVTVMLLAVSSRWKALFNSSPFSVIFWNKIRLTSKDDSIGFATVVAVRERESYLLGALKATMMKTISMRIRTQRTSKTVFLLPYPGLQADDPQWQICSHCFHRWNLHFNQYRQ